MSATRPLLTSLAIVVAAALTSIAPTQAASADVRPTVSAATVHQSITPLAVWHIEDRDWYHSKGTCEARYTNFWSTKPYILGHSCERLTGDSKWSLLLLWQL